MVKFKVTTGQQEVIELAYEPTKTLFDYIDDLSELYDTPPESFKLVNKGRFWPARAQLPRLSFGKAR